MLIPQACLTSFPPFTPSNKEQKHSRQLKKKRNRSVKRCQAKQRVLYNPICIQNKTCNNNRRCWKSGYDQQEVWGHFWGPGKFYFSTCVLVTRMHSVCEIQRVVHLCRVYFSVRNTQKLLSCVRLFATPWIVAHQAPRSVGFSRHEYWSGLPFPSVRINLKKFRRFSLLRV